MYREDHGGMRGGAEHLARIHGTEEDKVNCPFYFKIGACRHGDRCSRQHHRPPFSQTVIIQHMWQNPYSTIAMMGGDPSQLDEAKIQEDFDEFYEEIFEELKEFGNIDEIQVCENLGDHMVGNVYVKFEDEEAAERSIQKLFGRYYAGRPLACEYSPVTDFRESRCRQYDEGTCSRGGYCNFMHVREPTRELRKHLEKEFGFRGGKVRGTGSMATLKGGGGGGGGGYRGGGGGGYRGGGRGGGGYHGGGGRGDDRRDDRRDRSREREYRDRDDRRGDRGRESHSSHSHRDRSRDREARDSHRDGRGRDDRRDRSRERDRAEESRRPPRDDYAEAAAPMASAAAAPAQDPYGGYGGY